MTTIKVGDRVYAKVSDGYTPKIRPCTVLAVKKGLLGTRILVGFKIRWVDENITEGFRSWKWFWQVTAAPRGEAK